MSAITNFSLGTQRLTMVIIFTIIVGGLGQFFTFPRLEDPAIVIRFFPA
jgi:multidrug efflux pump subunit AcrB